MPSGAQLGSQLRRWRALHRIKQAHAAELFGVSQSTISRWEAGLQPMELAERRRVAHTLSARLDSAADHALARLVRGNPLPVHLICDLTHQLLACSAARAAQFSVPVSELLGRALWRYSTSQIAHQEAQLDTLGWRDAVAPPSLAVRRIRARAVGGGVGGEGAGQA
ncbi:MULTISPECIES: helix-turn-helix transcriptional regulator [Burkholderiaceae]|uniref:helix-turn-helix transcriptional regulator n=1 Tax=Burkholderiaceae TaxID=119060 RepID=UPI0009FA628E|nr:MULTISPECIES: helix-turn-helix transcriptional regulator [Burkholderiaceae]MCF2133762.1 helix-turn-helix domain-containing protein [Mycetohabitans sp. B3]MCG1018450.1 helix-turn-helix domain-containing protein [Mycetohabitans sp. B4]MCG1039314.1 helix-turn-helix domain-containing protein [Mycetohabitans sp. B7]